MWSPTTSDVHKSNCASSTLWSSPDRLGKLHGQTGVFLLKLQFSQSLTATEIELPDIRICNRKLPGISVVIASRVAFTTEISPNAIKSGAIKSANVGRLHLYHPSLDWFVADIINHHGGLPILRALSPSLGVGVRIWFRWDQGWAAATLECYANTRERLRSRGGRHIRFCRGLVADHQRWRLACGRRTLSPSAAATAGGTSTSRPIPRISGLMLSVPILITDVSVGDLVPVAGGPALTCGQVFHVNVDADSRVVHELGGVDRPTPRAPSLRTRLLIAGTGYSSNIQFHREIVDFEDR